MIRVDAQRVVTGVAYLSATRVDIVAHGIRQPVRDDLPRLTAYLERHNAVSSIRVCLASLAAAGCPRPQVASVPVSLEPSHVFRDEVGLFSNDGQQADVIASRIRGQSWALLTAFVAVRVSLSRCPGIYTGITPRNHECSTATPLLIARLRHQHKHNTALQVDSGLRRAAKTRHHHPGSVAGGISGEHVRHRFTPNLHRGDMATVTRIKNKRGTVWRVQVCVRGVRDSARFPTKPEAQRWGYERETQLRNGPDLVAGKLMADAFDRYAGEIPLDRKGRRWDLVRLEKFKTDPIARIPAARLTLEDAEAFIDRGITAGLAPNTIIREMGLMKPVVRRMVRWKWLPAYPWDALKMPAAGKRRTKLYTADEIERIRLAAPLSPGDPDLTVTQQTVLAFMVALETGMRLNEIVSIRSEWWDRSARVIHLPADATKTDTARDVPLSTAAMQWLSMLTVRPSGRLFAVNAQTASTLFYRVRGRAGITDGTFHDSRHYAITKLSKTFDVLSLARVIGHSDIRELMTYFEADAAELATLLD